MELNARKPLSDSYTNKQNEIAKTKSTSFCFTFLINRTNKTANNGGKKR
jgi:hypothetical protein